MENAFKPLTGEARALCDRMIRHYETCPADELSWSGQHCASGMLHKWDLESSELGGPAGAKGIANRFGLPYSQAEVIYAGMKDDLPDHAGRYSASNIVILGKYEPAERRAIILAMWHHLRDTGEAKWPMS